MLALLLGAVPGMGLAGTVLGIVSERTAAEMAAGAHRFVAAHPEHQVILRTPEQLASVSSAQVTAWFDEADAVLLAAVFGDQVERLVQLLGQAGTRRGAFDFPVLAVNGDQRLTRLTTLAGRRVMAGLNAQAFADLLAAPAPGESPRAHLTAQQKRFPAQADWLQGRGYYQGRTPEHLDGLMRWLLVQAGYELELFKPEPRAAIRYYRPGTQAGSQSSSSSAPSRQSAAALQDQPASASPNPAALNLQAGPVVAIIDLDSGDRPGDKALLDATCQALEKRDVQCFAVLANWGGASLEAIQTLGEAVGDAQLSAILSLQDFTIGGGEGRREVSEALAELEVPVLKGIRLVDRNEEQWRLSADGMPSNTVHYQLAMPELQGISQPMVLAVAAPATIDEITGVGLTLAHPVADRVTAMVARLQRWQKLRELANADKRVALVYYNHPPGRQNIGADNLDVPASLFEMLSWLKKAGYDLGDESELPDSPAALLDLMMEKGVNLPEDQQALSTMKKLVPSLSKDEYAAYFDTLSPVIQAELNGGPIGYLHARLTQARQGREPGLAADMLARGVKDIRHLLEQHSHPAQARALDLLEQYESGWQRHLEAGGSSESLDALAAALTATSIPGLSGWGPAPGRSMVIDEQMLFPGLRFGNIFLGPQPPRGWELDEALLHANTTFPPTHQYVGFYHWLREHFAADALVYVGRHSTREFLPRRRAGLTSDDYPDILGADLPLIYPYIVDGVGEGIQAKRRSLGVMISHLTPPLAATELYDDLLELRQLVETYESALEPDSPTRRRALDLLRERIGALELTGELEREIASEQGIPADQVSLDEISPELLVHEAGHYLTDMQERFMPLGLHVFGQDWDDDAMETMLASMAGRGQTPNAAWRKNLKASTVAERENWLAALEGRFVPPGQGNDPIRTPEVLPTGRNFHALSSDLIPTRVAWSLGSEMAAEARARGEAGEGSEALVLWASDTVRDEGVMIAFGLNLLGITPRWNSRGIVNGLERLPLDLSADATADRAATTRQRRDVLFTTSGLFRDLYEDQLVWLDLAVRLALDGASETINARHPQLRAALDAALAPLPEELRHPGAESLDVNLVAARWVADSRELLAAGASTAEAGEQAALRVFGTAPGSYGAGVNRLASRSGAWTERSELARAYQRRMGHAYGKQGSGEPAHAAFAARLAQVGRTYLGRASHLYGLLDNDDGFDFQGGLSTAVEHLSGKVPDNRVLQYADAQNPRVESLERALLGELRSRNLNPQWLRPLMDHGYAGARTMGSDFLDNLWGWQVTSPEVVQSWVWDEVNAVYFQDSHGIGMDEFLSENNNRHVQAHMQAIALLAAQRGYWTTDEAAFDALAEQFAASVVEHGLPGSGHTRPDHPLLDWIALRLDPALGQDFERLRGAARTPPADFAPAAKSIREINQKTDDVNADPEASREVSPVDAANGTDRNAEMSTEGGARTLLPWLMALLGLLLVSGGFAAGRRIS